MVSLILLFGLLVRIAGASPAQAQTHAPLSLAERTDRGLVILQPTGAHHLDLPVFAVCRESLCENTRQAYLGSYIARSIGEYDMVQNFLFHAGAISQKDPLYVAFTDRQGGFPAYGFFLQSGDSLIDKTGVAYIDLHKSRLGVRLDGIDSESRIIPHELGHVLSRSLADKRDEEAKAFAFSFAWMETIKENNIAGLGRSIVFDNPAKNGIHDIAFNFTWKLIKEGKQALELYWDLVRKIVSVPVCS